MNHLIERVEAVFHWFSFVRISLIGRTIAKNCFRLLICRTKQNYRCHICRINSANETVLFVIATYVQIGMN